MIRYRFSGSSDDMIHIDKFTYVGKDTSNEYNVNTDKNVSFVVESEQGSFLIHVYYDGYWSFFPGLLEEGGDVPRFLSSLDYSVDKGINEYSLNLSFECGNDTKVSLLGGLENGSKNKDLVGRLKAKISHQEEEIEDLTRNGLKGQELYRESEEKIRDLEQELHIIGDLLDAVAADNAMMDKEDEIVPFERTTIRKRPTGSKKDRELGSFDPDSAEQEFERWHRDKAAKLARESKSFVEAWAKVAWIAEHKRNLMGHEVAKLQLRIHRQRVANRESSLENIKLKDQNLSLENFLDDLDDWDREDGGSMLDTFNDDKKAGNI